MKTLAKVVVTILLISLLATSANADRQTVCYEYMSPEPIWSGRWVRVLGDEPFAISTLVWEEFLIGWTQGYWRYFPCP